MSNDVKRYLVPLGILERANATYGEQVVLGADYDWLEAELEHAKSLEQQALEFRQELIRERDEARDDLQALKAPCSEVPEVVERFRPTTTLPYSDRASDVEADMCEDDFGEYMTVAQHERIVAALKAQMAGQEPAERPVYPGCATWPEWANWCGLDPSGYWVFYECEPVTSEYGRHPSGGQWGCPRRAEPQPAWGAMIYPRIAAQPAAQDVSGLEPVHGDVLPAVGSQVFIHLATPGVWAEHTVVGYYAWPDLDGKESLHRIFVRVRDSAGYLNARLLKDVRTPEVHRQAQQQEG